MNKMKFLALFVVLACLLCACGGNQAPADNGTVPPMTLGQEDQEMLEAVGDDLMVVSLADFASTVPALSDTNFGMMYQITGVFKNAAAEGELPTLNDEAGTVSLPLNMLGVELNDGEMYTIIGVISGETHDGHAHVMLDVVSIESYTK